MTIKKSSKKWMRREDGVFVETPLTVQGRILGEIDASPPLPPKEKGRMTRGAEGSDELINALSDWPGGLKRSK
ncbi:hypothetical protein B9Z19DRAFT_1133373 [Tuber borchii]|uniref:Uncharacterized protein n=1 Tax=Tuber borchii TaxID=42251 RepID=A0A2T6ZFZ7_TUBBO|nr:hypothetical protein B9Z19DRAFT_1133373 [Tuber borchii]